MKSYFLEGLGEAPLTRSELEKVLKNQIDPWLLISENGEPIAYFNVSVGDDGASCIQADLSGRHFYQDEQVLRALRKLQRRLGGVIRDDDNNEL